MDKNKTKKIEGLKSEVNEFHPILDVLFRKLPDIQHVEYNHGPHEMGADFVLSKKDSTLQDTRYIGVIVKIGTIKQDHADIDKQIQECEIKRYVDGGTKEIYLNEIWITSNANITNAAQQKIHHKYNNKNISFISCKKLVELIDLHYPEYWHDVSVKVGQYLRSISHKAEMLQAKAPLSNIPNSEIYIEQDLVKVVDERHYDDRKRKKRKRLRIESILKDPSHTMIQGSLGTGKSTLIGKIAKEYSTNESYNITKTIPILLSAKELIDKYNSSIFNIVNYVIDNTKTQNAEHNFIVLIDALDELRVKNEERLSIVKGIYDEISERSDIKIIITSRGGENPEINAEIDKYFNRYSLCNLSFQQLIDFIDKICLNLNIKEKLLRDLDKSHLIKVLPRTPISAILLARLLKEEVREIPSTMTDLYAKYMELTLGRWDLEKGVNTQIEYHVIFNVSIDIAKLLIDNSIVVIAISDARKIFNDYLDSRNIQIDRDALFDKLLNNQDVYLVDKEENTIRFLHRTFAEYLYAEGLSKNNSAVISENIYNLYWATSYFFYLGIRQDNPELIDQINKIAFTSELNRLLKIFNNGNFLLASHLTPYSHVSQATRDSFIDASKLFYEIVNKKIDSPLSTFSQIQLLCVFTHCLCDSYGYDYFSEALEDHALNLCIGQNLNDIEFCELFFVNSVLLVTGRKSAYDLMIEKYGRKMPYLFQIGIYEHSHDMPAINSTVKRFTKYLKKKISHNNSLRQSIVNLYKKSIKMGADKLTGLRT